MCILASPESERYYKTCRFGVGAKDYTVTLFEGTKTNRHYALNFPLYNGVQSVQVGVSAGATVTPPLPFQKQGTHRRVWYLDYPGGMCCSTGNGVQQYP